MNNIIGKLNNELDDSNSEVKKNVNLLVLLVLKNLTKYIKAMELGAKSFGFSSKDNYKYQGTLADGEEVHFHLPLDSDKLTYEVTTQNVLKKVTTNTSKKVIKIFYFKKCLNVCVFFFFLFSEVTFFIFTE